MFIFSKTTLFLSEPTCPVKNFRVSIEILTFPIDKMRQDVQLGRSLAIVTGKNYQISVKAIITLIVPLKCLAKFIYGLYVYVLSN